MDNETMGEGTGGSRNAGRGPGSGSGWPAAGAQPELPVVVGMVAHGGTVLIVNCPYCEDAHEHGNVEGRRMAECFKGEYIVRR